MHQAPPVDEKKSPKALAQVTVNPSTPPTSAIATAPLPVTLNIHGIMSGTTGNVALINDQVYQEGDSIEGTKITKINLDSIVVTSNGVEQKILLKN
jgi:type II secretory pathway component PulC